MIFSILLIYLIILCFYFSVRIKKNLNLIIYNKGQLIITIFIIILFFIFYVLGLRILNLFRINKALNLLDLNFNYNLIFILIFIVVLRNLIFFFFKISWFKFHYVMMSEMNFSQRINKTYKLFFYKIIYSPAQYSFIYFVYINYVMFFLLLLTFFYDLFLNNFVLNYSLYFLKYYSFFKLIYFSYSFMITKQSLLLDYYAYNQLYCGNLEKNLFINFKDSQHKFLMEESKEYNLGIIMEKKKYTPKFLGNINEMPYFNNR